VATTSPSVYKQLHIPQVEREEAIQSPCPTTETRHRLIYVCSGGDEWRDLKWEFLTGLVLFAGGRLTPGLPPPTTRMQFSFFHNTHRLIAPSPAVPSHPPQWTPVDAPSPLGHLLGLRSVISWRAPHQRFPILLRSHPFCGWPSSQLGHPSDMISGRLSLSSTGCHLSSCPSLLPSTTPMNFLTPLRPRSRAY
jgi:hypothetical protein